MRKPLTFVFIILAAAIAVSSQTTDKKIEKIRSVYTDIAEKARLAETDEEQGQYGALVMNEIVVNKSRHQWRAVGIYGQTYRFFYNGGDSEKHLYPDHLVMVKGSRAVSGRKYDEEYLFDDAGQLVFYYQRSQNDDSSPAERRIYFSLGRAIRIIEDGKSRDRLTAADTETVKAVVSLSAKLRSAFKLSIEL